MRFSTGNAHRAVFLAVGMVTMCSQWRQPSFAQSSVVSRDKLAANMVLTSVPKSSSDVVLTVWNKSEPIHTTVSPETIIQGMCLHCNKPMSFPAGKASASCSVCPCGASFAECITPNTSKKSTWREMMQALPTGTGLRVEFRNAEKPDAGVMLLKVDLRSVLLPLTKPLQLSDSDLLKVVKPFGARSIDRADGDRLIRLALKDDWTTDRAHRLMKALADHGITVNLGNRIALPVAIELQKVGPGSG